MVGTPFFALHESLLEADFVHSTGKIWCEFVPGVSGSCALGCIHVHVDIVMHFPNGLCRRGFCLNIVVVGVNCVGTADTVPADRLRLSEYVLAHFPLDTSFFLRVARMCSLVRHSLKSRDGCICYNRLHMYKNRYYNEIL